MVATLSTMQSLGSPAFYFKLTDVRTNLLVELSSNIKQPILLMFICNHCPYVLHLISQLTDIANQAQENGFFVAAISSNDIQSYPQDSPVRMLEFANNYGFNFPYLFDESQTVAKNYGAAYTPDFFVYDKQHKLAYRGQMDNASPTNTLPVNGDDLSQALYAVLSGNKPPAQQLPSIGCNIKWKPGNEPF